jgi:DNA-binding NtrC family response regulator
MPTRLMPVYGRQTETGHLPRGITDVITVGEEATVFHPVRRALQPTGWVVAHASGLDDAITWLRSNVAAVAVADAEGVGGHWSNVVSGLRSLADAPEVVLVAWNELQLEDALRVGAFDVVQRPCEHFDLLWAVATAWHNWMTRRERGFGGGRCSDA